MTEKRHLVISLLSILALVLIAVPVAADDSPSISDRPKELLKERLADAKARVQNVTVEQLASLMDTCKTLRIVDVRTEEEYQAGHLRAALWMPRGLLEWGGAYGRLGSDTGQIVVYCRKDGRASLSALALHDLGFVNVRYLTGGFKSWAEAGQPVYNVHGEMRITAFEKSESDSTADQSEK